MTSYGVLVVMENGNVAELQKGQEPLKIPEDVLSDVSGERASGYIKRNTAGFFIAHYEAESRCRPIIGIIAPKFLRPLKTQLTSLTPESGDSEIMIEGDDFILIKEGFENAQKVLLNIVIDTFAFYFLGSHPKHGQSFTVLFKRGKDFLSDDLTTALINVIGYFYTNILLDELKRGFHQEYMEIEEESSVLRGRILFHKLMRIHKGTAHKLPVRYYAPSYDTLLNRIFLYVSDLLAWHTTLPIVRKNAYEIIDLLEDVKFIDILPHDFSRVTFNRLTERFKEAFELAQTLYGLMLLKEDKLSIQSLKFSKPFIFDTATTYENIIGKILNATGYEVHPQEEGRISFEGPFFIRGSEIFGEGNHQLIDIREYPDFIIIDKKDRKNVFIVDAKYKELFKPIGDHINDIRQIKSYLENKKILEKISRYYHIQTHSQNSNIVPRPRAGFLIYFYYIEDHPTNLNNSHIKKYVSNYKESPIVYWKHKDEKRVVIIVSINLRKLIESFKNKGRSFDTIVNTWGDSLKKLFIEGTYNSVKTKLQ